jgi:hydrogenase maturation protease
MRSVVIGIGNPVRGDDRAGMEIASRVTGVESHFNHTGGYEMIEIWEGADEVILADAVRSGAPPGTIHRLDASGEPLPVHFTPASTHSAGIAQTIELARSLGRLPRRVLVYGIEVGKLIPGEEMTPVVARAVAQVVEEIEECTSRR